MARFPPHRFQNDSWPTQNLDQQIPGMEMAGPLHPVLKAMMLRGLISRLMYIYIYIYIPAGSTTVAWCLLFAMEYIEKGTRKPGSHVVCNTDAVWWRMDKMLQEN